MITVFRSSHLISLFLQQARKYLTRNFFVIHEQNAMRYKCCRHDLPAQFHLTLSRIRDWSIPELAGLVKTDQCGKRYGRGLVRVIGLVGSVLEVFYI
jgi:hypothetical protein